jgi:hypothetical protein
VKQFANKNQTIPMVGWSCARSKQVNFFQICLVSYIYFLFCHHLYFSSFSTSVFPLPWYIFVFKIGYILGFNSTPTKVQAWTFWHMSQLGYIGSKMI